MIAVDRYVATFYPLWYRNRQNYRRTWLLISVVWVASIIPSIPPLLGFGGMKQDSYDKDIWPNQCVLFDNLDFVLFSSSTSFTVPALIMLVLYGRILLELKKR